MRVTILTVGSRGDVQPFIAFGRALAAEGHDVRLAAHPRFMDSVVRQRLDFAPLAEGHLSRGSETAAGRRWIQTDADRLPTWIGFIRDARSVASRRLLDALAACRDAEVIVASNLAMVLGWQMAAHYGVPLVRVFIGPPAWMLAKRPNPRVGAAVRQLAWLVGRPWLNRVRRSAAGLTPMPMREPFAALDRCGMPVLYAFSPTILAVPPGLTADGTVTGFWFLDDSFDPEPPEALKAFLDAGQPPVAVGFSTMIDADPARRTRLVLDALEQAGVRGVLQGPAEVQSEAGLGPNAIAVGEISHTWLFPRCAAVVHHGAVGTTAAGLLAGVPAVTIPHMTDQFVWARRLHELGVSPAPIPRRELTVARLADAIRQAAGDDQMRRNARALSARLGTEDGVAGAVDVFEARFSRPRGAASRSSDMNVKS
jgi:UDP:flavonoid glycosyltransferase YjiC (YdhE family)